MEKPSISRDDAIKLATQRVKANGVMSLSGRDTAVTEEPSYWHVYFPFSSPEVLGGEPHVFVDKFSGAIIQVYYTQ